MRFPSFDHDVGVRPIYSSDVDVGEVGLAVRRSGFFAPSTETR